MVITLLGCSSDDPQQQLVETSVDIKITERVGLVGLTSFNGSFIFEIDNNPEIKAFGSKLQEITVNKVTFSIEFKNPNPGVSIEGSLKLHEQFDIVDLPSVDSGDQTSEIEISIPSKVTQLIESELLSKQRVHFDYFASISGYADMKVSVNLYFNATGLRLD